MASSKMTSVRLLKRARVNSPVGRDGGTAEYDEVSRASGGAALREGCSLWQMDSRLLSNDKF